MELNLKPFTVATKKGRLETAPTMGITYMNGRVYFNSATVKILSYKKGDAISFYQDADNPTAWYFAKSENEGNICLKTVNSSEALEGFNSLLTREMLKTIHVYESCRFFIGSKRSMPGRKEALYQILTDRPITHK